MLALRLISREIIQIHEMSGAPHSHVRPLCPWLSPHGAWIESLPGLTRLYLLALSRAEINVRGTQGSPLCGEGSVMFNFSGLTQCNAFLSSFPLLLNIDGAVGQKSLHNMFTQCILFKPKLNVYKEMLD